MSDYEIMARYEETGRVSGEPETAPAPEQAAPQRDLIFELEGSELEHLRAALNRSNLRTLRFHPRREGFAWKVNEGAWSPTVGTANPRQ